MGTSVETQFESKEWRPDAGRPAQASPPPVSVSACPLTEEQFLLIGQTAFRKKAVRKAARTALLSSSVTLVLGVIAVPCVILWPSWQSAMIAGVLCTVGTIEYFGSLRMRRAEPGAPAMLGFNQLGFLAAIILYCLLQMATFSSQDVKNAAVSAEFRNQMAMLPDMERSIDGTIDRWAPLVMYGFYCLVIVLSVFSQGGLSLYYFTRRRHVRAYNDTTPAWARRVLLAAES